VIEPTDPNEMYVPYYERGRYGAWPLPTYPHVLFGSHPTSRRGSRGRIASAPLGDRTLGPVMGGGATGAIENVFINNRTNVWNQQSGRSPGRSL